MLDPLPVLGNTALLVLFVLSLWQWRRRPSPQRADILLLFGALSVHVVAFSVWRATGSTVAGTISHVALLGQPYAAVRLVRHFRPLPASIHGAAFVGFGASAATVTAASVADLPPWLFAPVLLYTMAANLYALLSLVGGRRGAVGVTRQRLTLAIIGFGAFTAGLASEGLVILAGGDDGWVAFSNNVVFLVMAASLPPAFTPPWRLRRLWQSLEVRMFLEHLRQEPMAPDAIRGALGEAAQRVSGGQVTLVDGKGDGAQAAGCADPASSTRFEVGRDALLVVCMDHPALFPEEDEELIRLLAGVAAAELTRATVAAAQAEALAEARRLERMKSEFVRTMAHELGNPLSPIQLQLPGLASDDERRRQASLAVVTRNVERLRRLVVDLRDVSHLHDGRVALDVQPVDLGELVRESVASHVAAATDGGCRFEVQVEEVSLRGDPWRLAQCLDNVLGNAVKYSPGGGTIRIRSETANGADTVRLAVSDEGLGMDADQQRRLFRPYERLHRDVAPALPGTGLGLVIVERLIQLHGGTVHVASAGPGQGTTFTIELPVDGPRRSDAAERG